MSIRINRIVVLIVSMIAAGGTRAAPGDSGPEGEPVLVAVRAGPGNDSYTLVCRGDFQHRLVQGTDRLTLVVELPRVANGVRPGTLPGPGALVRAISINESGSEPTQVRFQLRQPATASAQVQEDGLEVHLFPADPLDPDEEERVLGVEDLLEINVFEVPELTRSLRISQRGTISLPLLGEVRAEGLTPRELEGTIRTGLSERYVLNPQVSVFVKEHGSKKVSVLGSVGEPGVYEMVGTRTLLQILSQAGGIKTEAGLELFVIRNHPDAATERISVDIGGLLSNKDPDFNLIVEPGDVISVPRDRPIFLYVDGAVKDAGRLEEKESRPISLLQAIAKAGGTTERANLKGVQILRRGQGNTQTVIEVNLKRIRKGKDPDPLLRDGDVIVVPETFF